MGGLSFGLHIALVISFVSLFAWGCDGGAIGSSSGARRPPTTRPMGYHVVDVVNGGALSGTVLWSGPLPELVRVTVEQHADPCGATRELRALSVSPRRGVSGTVVYLDGITEGRALPTGPFDVSLEGCEIVPRVLAVPGGSSLRFVNRDGFLHNVHATAVGGSVWADVGLPSEGSSETATVPASGISTLVDDAGHPWMGGFVHAFAHPYFAVTDVEGRFRIAGVPPGQYTVRTWHEGVRAVPGRVVAGRPQLSQPLILSRPVVIAAGTETTVDFQIDLRTVDAAGN